LNPLAEAKKTRIMPTLISQPTRIQSAGNKPKRIDEYIGRVNSHTTSTSVAHMRSPAGWLEPGQTPTFDEFTVVLKGTLRVEYRDHKLSTGNESLDEAPAEIGTQAPRKESLKHFEVSAGQAVIAHAGQWVRYSTPHEDGAEYIAVCLPAFSMDTVHRDE
jgi:mannose-6-phosphate isomerase-like protein (cupin superfamily)